MSRILVIYGAAAVLNVLGCNTAANRVDAKHEKPPSTGRKFALRIMSKEGGSLDHSEQSRWKNIDVRATDIWIQCCIYMLIGKSGLVSSHEKWKLKKCEGCPNITQPWKNACQVTLQLAKFSTLSSFQKWFVHIAASFVTQKGLEADL